MRNYHSSLRKKTVPTVEMLNGQAPTTAQGALF